MVICRFFLEGRCKFGENCRNEHFVPLGNRQNYDSNNYKQPLKNYGSAQPQQQQYFSQSQHQRSGSNSAIAPQRLFAQSYGFGAQTTQYNANKNNYESLHPDHNPKGQDALIRNHLNLVKEDMINWEKSGQWPFSSYSPLLHRLISSTGQNIRGGSLPGFSDYSPEEIRWEMCKNTILGTVDQFIAKLQQVAADYSHKRLALQNMDQVTADFVVRYETGGMANPIGTVFTTTPISLISNDIDLQPNNTPAFSSSLLATNSQSNNPASSFKFTLPSSAANAPASSSFSFKSPTDTPSLSVFQSQQPHITAPSLGFGIQNSINQNMVSQPVSVSPHQKSSELTTYTPLNNLGENEINSFTMAKFCVGKIPLNPPPKELCV